MPKLTVDVKKLQENAYNVQRRQPKLCAIVSSQNGETVLEAVTQEDKIIAKNSKTFIEAETVHITLKGGKPVAVCCNDNDQKQVLIWAIDN